MGEEEHTTEPVEETEEHQGKTNTFPEKSRSPVKKELNDYVYYLGSTKHASEYEQKTVFIIDHIKKEFEYGNDIACALD